MFGLRSRFLERFSVLLLCLVSTHLAHCMSDEHAPVTVKEQMRSHHVGDTVAISEMNGATLRVKIVVVKDAKGAIVEVAHSNISSVRKGGLSRRAKVWIVIGVIWVALSRNVMVWPERMSGSVAQRELLARQDVFPSPTHQTMAIAEALGARTTGAPLAHAPGYNVAPTTTQPVLRQERDTFERELVPMRWAPVGFGSPKIDPKRSTFNARSEGLANSSLWKHPLHKQGCRVLVPSPSSLRRRQARE